MASRIKAISAYRPKIDLESRVGMKDLVKFIARSTGLNESGVMQVLLELRDSVVFFASSGHPVYIEGLGTYTPTLSLNGKIDLSYRPDVDLRRASTPNSTGDRAQGEHRQEQRRAGRYVERRSSRDDPVFLELLPRAMLS